VEAVAIKLLSAEVVFALFEVEPNHRVGRAMLLRLVFVSKQGKWKGGCAGRTELDDHDSREARKRLQWARSSHCGSSASGNLMRNAAPHAHVEDSWRRRLRRKWPDNSHAAR
jgi:hypothetical protein